MATEYQYATLMCSLPAYESLYASKQTPISRIGLDARLNLLEHKDLHDINVLAELLDWFRHPLDRTDAQLLVMAEKSINTIHDDFIKNMVVWRLELRTVVAALRRKHAGQEFTEGTAWGYGRWVAYIERNYQDQYLGLENFFPWVVEVSRLLESGDAMAIERCLLSEVWRWLNQISCGHEFDLEAVAIYRMRWDLVARWITYDKKRAEKKFCELIELTLPE